MLEHALQYAGRGWPVFRVTGFKTPFKGSHGHLDATLDPAIITRWWTEKPRANIALATGDIVVLDADGPGGLSQLQRIAAAFGGLPRTLTARTARGYHLYFKTPSGSRIPTFAAPRAQAGADGLDIKGHGGFVVLPPSRNAKNSFVYKWILDIPPAEMPEWLVKCLFYLKNKTVTVSNSVTSSIEALGPRPGYLQASNAQSLQQFSVDFSSAVTERAAIALATPWTTAEEDRLRSALASIPADCERDKWLHIGMALHGLGWERADGTDAGLELWDRWSATGKNKYQGLHDLETRWRSFGKPGRTHVTHVTLGTLYHHAAQHGWQQPVAKEVRPHQADGEIGLHENKTAPRPTKKLSDEALSDEMNGHVLPAQLTAATTESPLIDLNSKYAVIGDIGGKCLVLGWVRSKVDDAIQVPSFQTFKSFTERHSNRFVIRRKPQKDKWVDEIAGLGTTWLNWGQRVSYEGIDLDPAGERVLPGNILNLWQGFAIEPRAGAWNGMREHIVKILARSDIIAMEYIIKWAAWKVQHPGERAEVALVFKGAKGSGKGTFANALRRMFGQHGLQIFNSKHLVGQFNSHQRNCLLLFADEAFWAGDKQGESVLKGMLTEPALMIEQKGIDATPWKNRLGVIMATNAEWVIPASHDERRYAVFDVSDARLKDTAYFKALHDELNNGGLEAMLYDLQHIDLKGWHPRKVPQTEALQFQKLRSLDPRYEWFESLLSDGVLYGANANSHTVAAGFLLGQAREAVPRLRDISSTALGRFLADMGCEKIHTDKGNNWRFAELAQHRQQWVARFGNWKWQREGTEWKVR